MSCSLKLGQLFEYDDKAYRVMDIDSSNLKTQRVDDLYVIDFKLTDLVKNETFKLLDEYGEKAVTPWDYGFDSLEEEEREEVRKQYETIEPLVLFQNSLDTFYEKYTALVCDIKKTGELNLTLLLQKRAEQLGVCERKLWRLWKKWESGGFKGLISNQGQNYKKRADNNVVRIVDAKTGELLQSIPCRLSNKQVEVIENVTKSFYLKKICPSKKQALDRINIECSKENISTISKSTLYRILSSIEPRYQVLFRQGKKAFNQMYGQVDKRDNRAKGPLHVVQIDHTDLPIDVLDDERTNVVGRVRLTAGLDENSRMLWCLDMDWDHQSSEVVSRTIYQGILPKNIKETYGTENEWDVFGIPNVIYVDNAMEFHAKELRRIVEHELQSELRFRPPGDPKYGGIVERFFKTLKDQLIYNLEGTRKSGPKEIGERNPEKEACLTLSDLKKLIFQYITDIYPYQEHRGLPEACPIPAAMYQKSIDNYGFPRFVPASEKENFWLRLLPEVRRKVGREGIQINNFYYRSEETKALVGYSNLRIKQDLTDLSHIYLLHPKEDRWIEVHSKNPDASAIKGMTKYERRCIKEIDKARGEQIKSDYPQTQRILKIREEMDKNIEDSKKKTRKQKRQNELLKKSQKGQYSNKHSNNQNFGITVKLDTKYLLEETKLPEEIENKSVPNFEPWEINKDTW